jgi:hypothetical protein
MHVELLSEVVMKDPRPWHVASWRDVSLALSQRQGMIRRLAHRACSGPPDGELREGARGQVMWSCDTPQGPVGLSWDWFALRPGVLVMADPMKIVSNLVFVDDEGRPLAESQRIVELNDVAHALAWQPVVLRAHQGAAELLAA